MVLPDSVKCSGWGTSSPPSALALKVAWIREIHGFGRKKEYIICFLAERGNPLGTSADFKATPLESTFSEGAGPVSGLRSRERTPRVTEAIPRQPSANPAALAMRYVFSTPQQCRYWQHKISRQVTCWQKFSFQSPQVKLPKHLLAPCWKQSYVVSGWRSFCPQWWGGFDNSPLLSTPLAHSTLLNKKIKQPKKKKLFSFTKPRQSRRIRRLQFPQRYQSADLFPAWPTRIPWCLLRLSQASRPLRPLWAPSPPPHWAAASPWLPASAGTPLPPAVSLRAGCNTLEPSGSPPATAAAAPSWACRGHHCSHF